jgi:hypothetical protein
MTHLKTDATTPACQAKNILDIYVYLDGGYLSK